MGCLALTLLLILPTRFAFLLVWIFGDRVEQAFDGSVMPLLGVVFLPLTTLIYTLVWDPSGMTVAEISLVALAFLGDLAGPGGVLRMAAGRRKDAGSLV